MDLATSGLVYECKMPTKDGPVIEAMRDYSAPYPSQTGEDLLLRDGIVLGRDRAAKI